MLTCTYNFFSISSLNWFQWYWRVRKIWLCSIEREYHNDTRRSVNAIWQPEKLQSYFQCMNLSLYIAWHEDFPFQSSKYHWDQLRLLPFKFWFNVWVVDSHSWAMCNSKTQFIFQKLWLNNWSKNDEKWSKDCSNSEMQMIIRKIRHWSRVCVDKSIDSKNCEGKIGKTNLNEE